MTNSLLMAGFINPSKLPESIAYDRMLTSELVTDPFFLDLDKYITKKMDKWIPEPVESVRAAQKMLSRSLDIILNGYENDKDLPFFKEHLEKVRLDLTRLISSLNERRCRLAREIVSDRWVYAREMAIPINVECRKYYATLVYSKFVIAEHQRKAFDAISSINDMRNKILSYGDSSIFKRVERFDLNYSLDKLASYADKFIAQFNDFKLVKEEVENQFRHML